MLKLIKPTQIFPLILIALDVAAAVVYAVHGDWKKAIYWSAAAVLSVTAVF
jgi:hypothetical protein